MTRIESAAKLVSEENEEIWHLVYLGESKFFQRALSGEEDAEADVT